MIDILRTLRDFAELFERRGIAYAVMGGLAVRVYGIPRATYDVDFTIAIDSEQLPGLYQELEQMGYSVPDPLRAEWVDRVAGMPVVKCTLFTEGRSIPIDMFLAETEFQESLLARRRVESIGGHPLFLVSVEDLVVLKLLAYRPRDRADLLDILFTQGQLDDAYLHSWVNQLNLRDRWDEIRRDFSGSS